MRSSSSDPRLRPLAYVNADRALLYRAVMGLFMAAKERFLLHLRPSEVRAELAGQGFTLDEDSQPLDAVLDQLCEWGNLEAHPDTSEVTTVEDFYRRRHLYQLTPEGEAAERAVVHYHETLRRPGELKAAALDDIRVRLGELCALAGEEPLDPGKVHRTLDGLYSRFDELTSHAQTFVASLQRTIDLHGVSVEEFLLYKQMLIEYLERFIGELVLVTGEIAAKLRRLEPGAERLLAVAAERDLADALQLDPARQAAVRERWRSRWQGLRSWFVGDEGTSQAEVLRHRARAAIPALLAAAAAIHERRLTKSDRTSDLRALARWFAEAPDDRAAHRLWRAAFGLTPARHLSVDAETLERRETHPTSPQTSWLDAPPLLVSPRLRKTGSYLRRGRPSSIVERGREKAALARLAAEESRQAADARRRLATGRRMRLSELGGLDAGEFQLFLDLLGEALADRVGPGPATATSSDGALHVTLEPTGDGAVARIRTGDGVLVGEDFFLTVRDALDVLGEAA